MKEEQKKHLIDMMQEDERLGLYEYIGECKGNDGNGCFMDSSGHDCGCYTRSIKQETEHLLSTEANKERLLEDVFNDEKRQGVKELIDKHKLEEASWKFNPLKKLDGEFLRHAFKEGAKWKAKISYSEDDMKDYALKCIETYLFNGDFITDKIRRLMVENNNKKFEEFKKK